MDGVKIEISMTDSDFSDSFYFRENPSKEQIIKALGRNQGLADEVWANHYDLAITAIMKIEDEDLPKVCGRLHHTGFPIKGTDFSIGATQIRFEKV